MRSARVQMSRRRVGIARASLMLPFAVLAIRAAHLSVDERGIARGEDQTLRTLKLAPGRGTIVDASGAELALSVDSPSIYAIPSAITDLDTAAAQLAPVLGWKRTELANRLHGRQAFLFLSRWVTPERARAVAQLGLAGVGVLDEPRRIYPHRGLAAQVVGFANIDGEGVRGIEQQEDAWLRGVARQIPVERDALGRLLWIGGEGPWNTAGGDVALTIDATLQADAESALRETVEATGAKGGIVIVMDPWSGEILSLAENPGYDPNEFRKVHFPATRSRAFLDALDPGSTLKAFLVAAALEAGSLRPDDRLDCENGSFRVPGKTIHDHHPHGQLSAAEVLQVSSNIGAVKIAYRLGASAHHQALRRFGFGSVTASRFPDESAGLVRPWKNWKPVDQATIAFGQGINVTAIQLAAATAVLANGGLWLKPRLVAARREAGGSWRVAASEAGRRVIGRETAAAVLGMLEGVVTSEGTGSRAGLRGVRVGGKTGTAQKYDAGAGAFADDRFEAWFIGVVPADDPKLAIVVGVDEPQQPTHTGGAAAAPLFARVAAAQLSRFGIITEPERRRAEPATTLVASTPSTRPPAARPKRTSPISSASKRSAPSRTRRPPMETLTRLEDRVLLPDFLGLTIEEVRQITANGPLRVSISGRGRAVAQEPPPGTVFAVHDGPVRIRFEASSTARGASES